MRSVNSILIILALTLALCAQDLPKFKRTLPSNQEICGMGWPNFSRWCAVNMVQRSDDGMLRMAEHYRDLRNEATGRLIGQLPSYQWVELQAAVASIQTWLSTRHRIAQYGYQGPGMVKEPHIAALLADLQYDVVVNWRARPVPTNNDWPVYSYRSRLGQHKPPHSSPDFNLLIKEEAAQLQEACRLIQALPAPARTRLQNFMGPMDPFRIDHSGD